MAATDYDLPKNHANFAALSPLSFLARSEAVHPNRIATIHGTRRITWAEAGQRCRRLASALTKRGIGKGDTVAAMLPNIPEMWEAHFGVPMAGAVLNALNIRLDAATIAFILQHGEAKILLTDREFSATIEAALAQIPAENRPHILFDKLFRAERPDEVAARKAGAGRTGSVLDAVRDEAKRLQGRLGKEDKAKLDEYFNSIRDVEQNIATDLAWLDKPKPEVATIDFGQNVQALDPELQAKGNFDYRRYQRLMFDVITLALQTDSTRVINYYARRDLNDGTHCYAYKGCPYGYHEMTHHGEEPDKLKWLTTVDTWYMEDWAYFIEKLKGVKEGGATLLDHTLLVWGSSGGTENAHNNTNLPTMLVGGHKLGIKHQGHLDKKDVRLGNLWQTMFTALGVTVPENFQGGEADGVIKELV